ncbi:hypothetical protein K3722_00455 [Leisingera caerulea]|uniref:Uncharacterized protein n=1 Tax=Leisingera caerulea TaxID=506591 RepID=A0ABY5WWD7_LEICA|nr:hypothetical protein [Leisingera caerulea]UWQ58639.1 hypothetical protein K3722_00455 [Leisingera caerulea]
MKLATILGGLLVLAHLCVPAAFALDARAFKCEVPEFFEAEFLKDGALGVLYFRHPLKSSRAAWSFVCNEDVLDRGAGVPSLFCSRFREVKGVPVSATHLVIANDFTQMVLSFSEFDIEGGVSLWGTSALVLGVRCGEYPE